MIAGILEYFFYFIFKLFMKIFVDKLLMENFINKLSTKIS